MATLAELHAFDLQQADASIWVFKTSMREGQPRFNGHWVGITDELATMLRTAVRANIDQLSEVIAYSVLAQNNEGSALTVMSDETHAHLIATQVANETDAKKARDGKHLANSKFCVAKFVHEGRVLLAIRKTDSSWSTRKNAGLIRMVFSDEELDVDTEPTFAIRPDFDFFVLDGTIFIRSKPNFESVMLYKMGHEAAFEDLKAETEFSNLFADVGPISAYVGSNKIHLRRAIAIQQKGHYKDAGFLERLRAEYQNMNLNIVFNEEGKIVPTVESSRDIFQALLDHRLDSRLTSHIYDVQNTEPVG